MEKTINKIQHIPGPWSTEVLGDTLRIIDSEGNDLILVGHCRSEIKQANGKLMAVAPELLEALSITLAALRDLVRQLPNDESLADYRLDFAEWAEEKAQAVIKKATE